MLPSSCISVLLVLFPQQSFLVIIFTILEPLLRILGFILIFECILEFLQELDLLDCRSFEHVKREGVTVALKLLDV